ncbi:hypothetical protein, unlikely [Trypanosoma brucei gambiense DAL972]|uniref:Uncharacterized protein n=1 Tax=Trypanosoma brucei gambiense (strain MHOM/CI/86/DAL972) TaxID=679716 RepID=C9ZR18_TRYB9|nr:hypothetical protein, unlikely [Trypanosoma brucei gambiense DAL972]CBH11848.1 hypothetical protein, unlikely [Trypanosoma brucei gambiense DAL972]|eukprot:XP_011774133.1 hypothetical protein, unlikely [Trypanosoma brucei gambiense DAL972]
MQKIYTHRYISNINSLSTNAFTRQVIFPPPNWPVYSRFLFPLGITFTKKRVVVSEEQRQTQQGEKTTGRKGSVKGLRNNLVISIQLLINQEGCKHLLVATVYK